MARRGLITWLSVGSVVVGLSTVVASFMGCYADTRTQTGKCQGDDDGNPCTDTTCPDDPTKIVNVPKLEGTECALGANAGKCDSNSICKLDCESNPESCKCTEAKECPVSNACVTWACTTGKCTRTDQPDMTPVDTADPNDCKKTVCISGAPQAVNDENDTLADVPGDCQKPTCVNMMPSTEALDTDEPKDEECKDWSCSNGEKTNKDADLGTECSIGVCDSGGHCVDCLSAPQLGECDKPGMACKVQLCNGETCTLGTQCSSGECADTVCCNGACDEACKSCNLAGTKGECANILYYEEDPPSGLSMTCEFGVAGTVCDGNGKCLKTVDVPCSQGSQCISNVCTSFKCLGAPGEGCSMNSQCASMMCSVGACK